MQNQDNKSIDLDTENTSQPKNEPAGWMLNAGNIGIFSATISIVITVFNKLMRMFGYNSLGLVMMLYILAGVAGFLALVCGIKNAKKHEGRLSLDCFLSGIAMIVLVLV